MGQRPGAGLLLLLKAIEKKSALLAAMATSEVLEFGAFQVSWQDMCQAIPGTEAEIILDPVVEKPTERVL